MNEGYNEGVVYVSEGTGSCSICGNLKTLVKKHRKGKGWRKWQRCDHCLKRAEEAEFHCNTPGSKRHRPGGRWKRTVDGEELNAIVAKYGGVGEYNKARKKAEKEFPLLVSLEFKPCSQCGKAMSLYQEIRHDRNGAIRSRWSCVSCRTEYAKSKQREYKGDLSERGKLILEQRGWDRKKKVRAKARRERQKTYLEDKGWTKLVYRKRGITKEQYWALLEAQGGECAIQGCNFKHRPEQFFAKSEALYESAGARMSAAAKQTLATLRVDHLLYVDHDHGTGAVRALLCAECNLVLGKVEKLKKRCLNIMAFDAFLYTHGNG